MSYYNDLKSKNDIMQVAYALGFCGTQSGKTWNGECPKHGSSSGRCLVIWPTIQGFKCYHCGEKGDVIDLVMLFKRCDHTTAVRYLAERVGMPVQFGGKDMSPEERALKEADFKEEALVYEMLTEAAIWYHAQLKNFPDIEDHLYKHYSFSKEIVEELKIGIAPPGTSGPEIASDLAIYLAKDPRFKGQLAKSGLFTFKTPQGPFWDYFKGRIIFPYWKNGKVANMTARATNMTPADQFQCYADREGKVKTDASGNPEYIKYKKLRRHDPGDEKKKHLSKFLGIETLMGSDSIRGARQIIITEGAPDWVSAVDNGFAALSPVTTNFREDDFEKLARAVEHADAVYIVNDNEENQAGLTGALKTGKYLTRQGSKVFLVELPRPAGIEKIDLNEYLKDHTADDLRGLIKDARSLIDIIIETLPADFVKAQPILRSEVMPLLLGLEESICAHYLDRIQKKVNTTRAAIKAEFEAAKGEADAKSVENEKETIDPVVESRAEAIAKDPCLIRKRIDLINRAGVVGERNVIAMYFSVFDSRLLPEDTASPNALALKNAGHHGSGKSFTLKKSLEIYPEEAYHMITSGSAKSLYYLPYGLKHRVLIIAEAFQFQANNAADSEFVYIVRSLLSEGRVAYQVPQKDDDGKFVTIEKKLEGPTAFITTTIVDKLEPQLEDRLFTIHPDESMSQTKAIMTMTARIKDGSFEDIDQGEVQAWKRFHAKILPAEVIIPFASRISEYIQQQDKLPISTRRAFNRVMAIIQTITCVYQFQRARDGKGRLIAEVCDYWMALQIVREAFRETLGLQSKEAMRRIDHIREKGPVQYNALKTEWGISKSALTSWVRGKISDNLLLWCDESGNEFADESVLKKAKHSGTAYLKVNDSSQAEDVMGLPAPYDLTKDDRWAEDGEFLRLYDLNLDGKTADAANAKCEKIPEDSYWSDDAWEVQKSLENIFGDNVI